MTRAVEALSIQPVHVLVDGNRLPALKQTAEAIIKGDLTVAEISAASIIAKVSRDSEMKAAGAQWPVYGFEKHMGYPTAKHLEALKEHGICPIHRKSYAPVQRQMDLWDEVTSS